MLGNMDMFDDIRHDECEYEVLPSWILQVRRGRVRQTSSTRRWSLT